MQKEIDEIRKVISDYVIRRAGNRPLLFIDGNGTGLNPNIDRLTYVSILINNQLILISDPKEETIIYLMWNIVRKFSEHILVTFGGYTYDFPFFWKRSDLYKIKPPRLKNRVLDLYTPLRYSKMYYSLEKLSLLFGFNEKRTCYRKRHYPLLWNDPHNSELKKYLGGDTLILKQLLDNIMS